MDKRPDEGIVEALASVMYAAPRCAEVKELLQVKDMLTARYGKEFAYKAANNEGQCVNQKVPTTILYLNDTPERSSTIYLRGVELYTSEELNDTPQRS
jgi:hypothetical protein